MSANRVGRLRLIATRVMRFTANEQDPVEYRSFFYLLHASDRQSHICE